ncbi:beta-carotene hydroxylase isoform X1 [Zea mays]|uniref:beta-carotene hydroxylase isoform X1 n=1 Tax=Zea mays TaxID=4577 RepID=UPI000C6C51BB|nr:beta-carotene hydroxylase isoform X1 [Zea mays]|eukprot:XP_023156751.1 beta-carotene hydroxylase isoform X1 [Zea mays]
MGSSTKEACTGASLSSLAIFQYKRKCRSRSLSGRRTSRGCPCAQLDSHHYHHPPTDDSGPLVRPRPRPRPVPLPCAEAATPTRIPRPAKTNRVRRTGRLESNHGRREAGVRPVPSRPAPRPGPPPGLAPRRARGPTAAGPGARASRCLGGAPARRARARGAGGRRQRGRGGGCGARGAEAVGAADVPRGGRHVQPRDHVHGRRRRLLPLRMANGGTGGGAIPVTEMVGTFALSVGAAVGMEFWARWAHRALWHASLWHMHESHHRARDDGPFELNDVFAIVNAVPAMSLLAYGFFNRGLVPGLCFGAGLGITLFGMAYMFVHDGLVHRRFPVGPIENVPYFRRVAAAHQIHHMDKFQGVPYGLFLGPKELKEVGGTEELEKEIKRRIRRREALDATQ